MSKLKLIRYGDSEWRLVLPVPWGGYLVAHRAPDSLNVFWRHGDCGVRRLYLSKQLRDSL